MKNFILFALSALFCFPAFAGRTCLTTELDLYVNGDPVNTAVCGTTGTLTCSAGNDSNDCLTPSTACLTTTHAINLMYGNYDQCGFTTVINLAHGASQNYAFNCGGGALPGNITFEVAGDYNNPTAVDIVVPSGGYGIYAGDFCVPSLAAFEITDSGTAAGGIVAGQFGVVDLQSITFAGNWNGSSALMEAFNGGRLNLLGAAASSPTVTNTVSSSQVGQVFQAQQQGVISIGGTVAFPNAITMINNQPFAVGLGGQFGSVNTGSFTGYGVTHATGKKCQMDCTYIQNDLVPNNIFLGNSNCTPYCGY